MKQSILSLFLLFSIISYSVAQKKSNLKVYAYAYDNSGKYAKLEMSNPNYPYSKICILKVWFKDFLCFNPVDEREVTEDVSLELSCSDLSLEKAQAPIPYKGKVLILYTINGKQQYYRVKFIKIVPMPQRDKNIKYLHRKDKKG